MANLLFIPQPQAVHLRSSKLALMAQKQIPLKQKVRIKAQLPLRSLILQGRAQLLLKQAHRPAERGRDLLPIQQRYRLRYRPAGQDGDHGADNFILF